MKAPDDQTAALARYMAGPALLQQAQAGVGDTAMDAPPPPGTRPMENWT
jgi:hypothetical protein